MSKLVDKERLAKLAKALDDRAKAAVAAEKERALVAEQAVAAKADANAAAIKAIQDDYLKAADKEDLQNAMADAIAGVHAHENKEVLDEIDADKVAAWDGAQAGAEAKAAELDAALKAELQAEIDADVKVVADDLANEKKAEVAGTLANKIAALEAKHGQGEGTVEAQIEAAVAAEQERADAAEKANAAAIAAEKQRAEGVEAGFEGRIAANEAFVAAQSAIDQAQNQRLADLEEMMGLGGEEGQGSALDEIRGQIEALGEKDTALQGEIDAAEQRLNVVEPKVEQLEAFVEGHDHAVMEQGIADNKAAVEKEVEDREAEIERVEGLVSDEASRAAGQEAAIRKDFVAADTQVLVDAKAYADQQITALVDSAPEAMNTLNELAKAINDNKDVYDGYVAEHATAMAGMKTELQAEIDADVKVVADELAKQKDAEQEGTLAHKIAAEQARAEGVEGGHATRIQALEDANKEGGAVAVAIKEAKDAADAAQAEVDVLEPKVTALAAALKDYSTTEEMKAVIGNVVSSLALTMEDNKVVLKLGGVDGIDLTSVSLDLATEEDIDAIVAGLDAQSEA